MPIVDLLRFIAARAVPAALGFLALVVFTRLLTPAQFGTYSVTLAGANVATAGLFYWLALSAVRFGVDGIAEREQYLGAILQLYAACVALTVAGFAVFALVAHAALAPALIAAGGLVLAESWFQLNQKLAIARVQPKRFAIMASTKVLVGLVVGALAALAGFGATGVMAGVIVGSLCAGFAPSLFREWRNVRMQSVSRQHLTDVLRYGAPLGVTVAFGYALGTVDRVLLTYYHGAAPAGEFSAGYDLAYATLTLAMTTVNMVAYPHVLNSADSGDAAVLRERFKGSLDLLLLVSLPVVVALVVFAPNLTGVVLGSQFADPAARVVPWVACATLIGGMRSYYLDVAFHMQRNTAAILRIVAVVVSVNVALNLLLIEEWKMTGALVAIVTAQVAGFAMSAMLGYRSKAPAPGPDRETAKIGIAAVVAAAFALVMSDLRGAPALCAQVALLTIAYCVTLAGLRSKAFIEIWTLMFNRFNAPASRIHAP
jgi:O-antigen/teichoic acid export membrane protein